MGVWGTRRSFATLTDVARHAGVSVTTASKAVNGQRKVSAETRARVLAAARELSFTPNPMAGGLISGRSGTVGLIGYDSYSIQRFILLGAESALSDVDLWVITTDTQGDTGRLQSLIGMMRHRKVDGVLMVGNNNDPTPAVGERLSVRRRQLPACRESRHGRDHRGDHGDAERAPCHWPAGDDLQQVGVPGARSA
ncbi:LacI family DNA-binding transcriptional regulator [Micromonospora radicis]|uniref:LacI family transcriptional regulator n=1 Tax=Micromonospora radicis TaxID=1894971 RepID=A0A418MWZ0_9ACTN|nr:LacI family transcriptional regulator [Micromonospora radicis]